jgi:hypothetical protein
VWAQFIPAERTWRTMLIVLFSFAIKGSRDMIAGEDWGREIFKL